MGDSAYGVVEVNTAPRSGVDPWMPALTVYPFVATWWRGWDSLFGFVGGDFDPVAPVERGLPAEVSAPVRRRPDDTTNESYLTLEELRKVDWDERADEAYLLWARREGDQTGAPFTEADDLTLDQRDALVSGETVRCQSQSGVEVLVTREEHTRRFVCEQSGWYWVIDEVMERLATRQHYPVDGVRLTTWRW